MNSAMKIKGMQPTEVTATKQSALVIAYNGDSGEWCKGLILEMEDKGIECNVSNDKETRENAIQMADETIRQDAIKKTIGLR